MLFLLGDLSNVINIDVFPLHVSSAGDLSGGSDPESVLQRVVGEELRQV